MTYNIPAIFAKTIEKNTEAWKKEVLSEHLDNWALKDILFKTYDPYTKYGIKKIPEYTAVNVHHSELDEKSCDTQVEILFGFLENISHNNPDKLRGNAASDALLNTLNTLTYEFAEILVGVLIKRQGIGMAAKSLNSVFGKDFILIMPYMRCSTHTKMNNIIYETELPDGTINKHGAIVQLKADGAFNNTVVDGVTSLYTRNGNEINVPRVQNELNKNITIFDGYVIHGEAQIEGFLDAENRSLSNGKINSLISKDDTLASYQDKIAKAKTPYMKTKLRQELTDKLLEWEGLEDKVFIEAWDIIPLEDWNNGKCSIPYEERWQLLLDKLEEGNIQSIKPIKSKVVYSEEEAVEFYNEQYQELGLEGAVLKNMKTLWKDGTSTEQIKLKPSYVIELRVIDFVYGDPNNLFNQGIGKFIMQTECGQFTVKVGGGLKYHERGLELINPNNVNEGLKVIEGFDFNQYNGKIASVEFYGIQKSIDKKNNETKYALQFAQFKGFRVSGDKNEADTLEYILDITGTK